MPEPVSPAPAPDNQPAEAIEQKPAAVPVPKPKPTFKPAVKPAAPPAPPAPAALPEPESPKIVAKASTRTPRELELETRVSELEDQLDQFKSAQGAVTTSKPKPAAPAPARRFDVFNGW